MPDIAMCPGERPGETCPLRDACYRHTAQPSEWQAWFLPELFGEKCGEFWPVDLKQQQQRKDGE